jgi:hypothetical protein
MAEKRKMRPSLRGLAEGYPVRHAGNANSRQRRLPVPADEGFVVALQIGWESIALGTADRGPGAGHSITGSLAGIAIRSAAEVPATTRPDFQRRMAELMCE